MNRLRVLSWNIHKAIGMDRRFRPERVAQVLRHHEADIALLQEVDRGVPRSRGLELDQVLAEMAGYPHTAFAQNVSLKRGGYGNATLSRHPIRKHRNHDLTVSWRKRRGCLQTQIHLPRRRKPLHVFNWHLGLSAMERKQQVEKWLKLPTVRRLKARDRVLVGGDSNDWRNLLFVGAGLKHAGFQAWGEGGRHRMPATYPSMAPVGALDKIFWRGPLQVERIHISRLRLSKLASDHLPLIAEIEL